ncbi:AMP-binding protein [Janthinobacterium sp. GW460P]|uniref:AMP-binding protein n=1 Tax=unclassified Janthinobacterium TaxID=2610881 RepID=UPI000A31EC8C|nr:MULTISPECIES: AMP-binding protein [unclassified Janthinobacterium]MCC7701322.1 AMP-binding protein [Janthinobacterium sp. GW460P]MCC7706829.1 AMP-binding protein [Janthinobacterium sp. GW460W]
MSSDPSPTTASPQDDFARAHLPPRALWPQLCLDLPELQYPPRLNCVAALLDAAVADGGGERTAILADGQRWTYAQLARQVDRIAHVLRADLGLIPGNRVLLRGANTPMMAACLLAVLKAGCIAVPTMPLLRARELSAILAKAQVNAVLCAQGLRGELDGLPGLPPMLCFGAEGSELERRMAAHAAPFSACDTAADDVCLISFTSGTTGVPKGTMHMHRDLLAICDCFPRSMLRVRPDDIFIGTPPLAFTFGLGGLLLFPLRFGAATVLLEKLTPETLLRAIGAYQATICFTAPTFYRQMAPLAAGHDLRSLRLSVSAGEALPLATRDAWQEATGLAMTDGIGATEMLHIFISATGEGIRRGAIGKAIPGYQACIVDDAGVPQPPGVTGRLAVKGPTGCRYLSDPRQREYVQNGWNLTGDTFEMDADGYFYYRSRSDDMIVSAGYNIAGPEVEEALLRHPAVAECGVVGRADAERGQIVEAHVVLKDGCQAGDALAAELQDFVRQQIAPYKYPRAIRFLPALPRTETGKLQRFKLRTDTP